MKWLGISKQRAQATERKTSKKRLRDDPRFVYVVTWQYYFSLDTPGCSTAEAPGHGGDPEAQRRLSVKCG